MGRTSKFKASRIVPTYLKMLQLILISILFWTTCGHSISINTVSHSVDIINCVKDIIKTHFGLLKDLTYITSEPEDGVLLEAVHSLNVVTITFNHTSNKLVTPHKGYLISSESVAIFIELFPKVANEPSWNPEALFLIIFNSLESSQIMQIFNIFSKFHVSDVIVINEATEGHIYSYNPFENYRCGKSFGDIINFGKCSQAKLSKLYPNKHVTGLHNCTFNLAIPHLPPYAVHPENNTDTRNHLAYGIEPYFLRLIGEKRGFTINITLTNEDIDSITTVSSDMEAEGAMQMLQDSKADMILGGQLLVPSNAITFDYIHDLLPYVDEIRFLVRQAKLVASWKTFYLEFDSMVWWFIIISLFLYSFLMVLLLRVKDKSYLILKLLDNLLLHGCEIRCQSTTRIIFLIWLWFSYLVNSFYQSSLVSLTTNPPRQKQISNEADIFLHKLKPCFSEIMQMYYTESSQSNHVYTQIPGCKRASESIVKVLNDQDYYTIFLYGLYKYNQQDFFDIYGHDHIYPLKEAYSKVIYCMYFYKGFPLINDIRVIAIRLREMGLVDKAMSDMIFLRNLKHHFHAHAFKPRFALPWYVYLFGCVIAAVTFIVEIIFKRT